MFASLGSHLSNSTVYHKLQSGSTLLLSVQLVFICSLFIIPIEIIKENVFMMSTAMYDTSWL